MIFITLFLSLISVNLNEVFPVNFTVTNAAVGETFYYKIYGGAGENKNDLHTFYNSNSLNYNSSWTNFPTFVISDEGNYSGTANVKATGDGGIYNLKIKIAKVSKTSSQFEGGPKTITVNLPSPTPTPTSTPTPIPTLIPTQTLIPTRPLLPTYTPIPLPQNPQNIPQITPEPILKKPPLAKNLLSLLFLSLGGLLLITPLIIPKLHQCLKK